MSRSEGIILPPVPHSLRLLRKKKSKSKVKPSQTKAVDSVEDGKPDDEQAGSSTDAGNPSDGTTTRKTDAERRFEETQRRRVCLSVDRHAYSALI